MRIKHIEIKGYHSIDFTGVAFPVNEIAAFIGKNSAGKSNVLEALDLFFNGKTLTSEDYYQRNTTQNIVITVSFELEENDQFLPLLMYANDVGVLCIRKEYIYGAKQPEVFILGSMIFKGTEDMNPTAKHSLTNVKKYIQKSEIKQNIQQTDAGFHFEAPTVDAYYQFLYSYWSPHIDQMEKDFQEKYEELKQDFEEEYNQIRQRKLERYKKGQERTEEYNRNLIEQFNKIIPLELEKDEALRLWKKYNFLMPPPDVISKYKSETNMSWTEFAMFVEKTY